MSLHAQFCEAAEAGDYVQIIRLAKENDLTSDLSDRTNIGKRTLRAFRLGNQTPSRNQSRKILNNARQIAL